MKRYLGLLFLLPLFLGLASLALGQSGSPEVRVLDVDGTIVPVVADYIDRGISSAEDSGAEAVIIRLRTPGGMLSTTEDIVDRILESEVPVVVYVDRWAGSAGTLITMASHIAAMAEASRIGAASPVGGGGEDLDETLKKKATQDTAASIRALADLRGRHLRAAEATVVEALSFTDQEALGLAPLSVSQKEVLGIEDDRLDPPLVEVGASDLEDLIRQLDGRRAELKGGTVVIDTDGYTVRETKMNWIERFLHAISDPNIAYILLSIGSLGIIIEMYSPGAIVPGTVGAVSLLTAFYSLSVLNAHWAGVILILLAFGLFVAEAFTASFGLLLAGGIASLIAGSIILFSGGPSMEGIGVDWWVIAVMVGTIAVLFGIGVFAVVRSQNRRQPTGADGLVGMVAEVRVPLKPRGVVMVHGELWDATVDAGEADRGEEVIVTDVSGLKLKVTKKKEVG